jgi:hypothetical protein
MRYYSYNEPDENEDNVVITVSEDDVRETYYPFWKGKMIAKYGEEEYNKRWSFEDCLQDWIVVHWAWESHNER